MLCNFDLNSIQNDSVILIIGCPKSGRTTLLNTIIKQSSITNGTILQTLETTELQTILFKQIAHSAQCPYDSLERRAYLALDNCFEDNTWIQNRLVRSLFSQNRTMGFLFVVTTDSVKARAIPPVMRGEIDYVVLFNEPAIEKRRTLYECFLHSICTFEQLCEWMDTYCTDYGCLVLDTFTGRVMSFRSPCFFSINILQ